MTSINLTEEIKRIKSKHKDIYQIKIADQVFIFKPISRKDYKEVLSLEYDPNEPARAITMMRETEMAKKVILYPNEEETAKLLEERAGIAEVITDECMRISGFVSDDERIITKL